MTQEALIIIIFNGLIYLLVILIIGYMLKLALFHPESERPLTQEAQRVCLSEQEVEAIIYELLEEV